MQCPTLDQLPQPDIQKNGWPWVVNPYEINVSLKKDQTLPKVSIVTPSFNQGPFLEETIRSVLLQGYPNLEYIIIDGGSTDGSIDIIKKYESWLSYWVSEPDAGQTHALNKGFNKTSGQIIAWLNSDDVYLQNAVFSAIQILISNEDVAMVYGDIDVIDEKNNGLYFIPSGPYDLKRLFKENYIPQPACFFKKNVFLNIGGLDESFNYIMDYDLWMRMGINNYSIIYFPQKIALFRLYDNSKCGSRTNKFWAEIFFLLDKNLKNLQIDQPIIDIVFSHMFNCIITPILTNPPNQSISEDNSESAFLEYLNNMYGGQLFCQNEIENIFYILKKEISIESDIANLNVSLCALYYRLDQRLAGKNLDTIYEYFRDQWVEKQFLFLAAFFLNRNELRRSKQLFSFLVNKNVEILFNMSVYFFITKYYLKVIQSYFKKIFSMI